MNKYISGIWNWFSNGMICRWCIIKYPKMNGGKNPIVKIKPSISMSLFILFPGLWGHMCELIACISIGMSLQWIYHSLYTHIYTLFTTRNALEFLCYFANCSSYADVAINDFDFYCFVFMFEWLQTKIIGSHSHSQCVNI